MRAIVRDRYGPADVLELRDVDRPVVGDDEVLLRVRAAGVDQGVWHLMAGLPYPIRLAGYGLRAPKNPVLGADVAGVVEAIGSGVTSFQPGDEVFGIAKGSYAEYARASEDRLAPKPANLTFEQAAVVAISGFTALQGLRDRAKVRPDQKVLIVGASGGVGTYAVQVAKVFGAHVTGVCSTTKVDLVRSLGADHVIDYTREDFADGQQRYEVILDVGGNASLSRLRRALTPKGTLVIAGARPTDAGSGAPIASSGRWCCRRSSGRSWARSSPGRTTGT
jgi:NADPH:quinone reductase-like Zn-dependent oxidoreductase